MVMMLDHRMATRSTSISQAQNRSFQLALIISSIDDPFPDYIIILSLFIEMVSASMNLSYILGRERKGFADARPHPVYLAAFSSGIVGRAALAASAASCTVSAPFGPPFHYLASPDIPNDPSSDPSVQHGKTIAF
jgi:hypothetical protein